MYDYLQKQFKHWVHQKKKVWVVIKLISPAEVLWICINCIKMWRRVSEDQKVFEAKTNQCISKSNFKQKLKNQITGFKYELGTNPIGLLFELYCDDNDCILQGPCPSNMFARGKRKKRRKVKPINVLLVKMPLHYVNLYIYSQTLIFSC